MNEQLFLAINNIATRWGWLDAAGIFLAEKLLYVFAIIVALLWLKKDLRRNAYLAIGSVVVGRIFIVELIKRLVNHPRPYEVVSGIHQILPDTEKGMSFPSGHTVIYFAIAFAFYRTKYFWPMLVLAALGSVARVFVGVHFPYDILASIAIAAAVVWGLHRLFKNPILS